MPQRVQRWGLFFRQNTFEMIERSQEWNSGATILPRGMVFVLDKRPLVQWRVLKRASEVADWLDRVRLFEMLDDGYRRFKSLFSGASPLADFSSTATLSIVALMTFSVALGSAGSASASTDAAQAALRPTSAGGRTIDSVYTAAPQQYRALLWGKDLNSTPAGVVSADAVRPELTSRSAERPAVPAPTNATESEAKFILAAVEPAQASQRETGVPASVTIAQAALESGWGKSKLANQAHNYFGIKALNGPGPAGVVTMDTGEYLGGQNVTVSAEFKAYHNMQESFTDHGKFLKEGTRYAQCFETKDPKEFARRVQAAGYATDPAYANKLIAFMDKYNLYAYDVQ